MKPSGTLRWPRVIALALAWQHFQVEQDYPALWRLLNGARTQAMRAGPVTVRFTHHRAVVENRAGGITKGRNEDWTAN